MSAGEWVGAIGVALLLLAFTLNLTGLLSAGGRSYAALNAAGAGLACAASWLIDFMPFVVLEGVWCLAATCALVRSFGRAAAGGVRCGESASVRHLGDPP